MSGGLNGVVAEWASMWTPVPLTRCWEEERAEFDDSIMPDRVGQLRAR
jgi:hypothetical protein